MGKRTPRKYCRNGHMYVDGSFKINYNGCRNCLVCRRNKTNKYVKSDKGKKTRKEYAQSDEGILAVKKSKENHSLELRNRNYIASQKRSGKLVMLGICIKCNNSGYTEIHHLEYLDQPKLSPIQELCLPCHSELKLNL